MGSRREEERNEKIIRGLMKLPPNRKCINCNSVGPQYVCTNFWTFTCLSCSGIHREFTHRVKSVSMAKFTTQEVRALEQGGNQRARDIYLKDWDWQRMRLPDNSKPDRIREFIRAVYVDKKYAGGKSTNKPATDSESVKSNESEIRRPDSYHSYSQSPPYDFQYEDRRYGKQVNTLARRPSDRALFDGKLGGILYSPGRVRDQMHEDRFANESHGSRFSDFSASSTGDLRNDALSPSSQDTGYSSPSVHHSRNVSSENPQSQRHPNAVPQIDVNGGRHSQRTASSGSFGSFDGSSVSNKSVDSGVLPDAHTERPVTGASSVAHLTQPNALQRSTNSPASHIAPTQGSVQHLPVSPQPQPMAFSNQDLFDTSTMPQPGTSSASIDLFAGFNQHTTSISSGHSDVNGSAHNAVVQKAVTPSSSVPAGAVHTSHPVHQDLFSLSILQEPATSSSPPSVDLFAGFDQQLAPMSSVHHITPADPLPANEGWAFFDTPQYGSSTSVSNVQAQVPAALPQSDGMTKTIDQSTLPTPPPNAIIRQTSLPIMDQWSSDAEEVKIPVPKENSQTWNAFGESAENMPDNLFAFNTMPQVPTHQFTAPSVPYVVSGTPQVLARGEPERSTPGDMFPGFNVSPGVLGEPSYPAPIQHELGMMSQPAKSTNPFDTAFESDIEANDMFMDFTSLQATLPDPNVPAEYSGNLAESWISQNSAVPYIPSMSQGGLSYILGQVQDPHMLPKTVKPYPKSFPHLPPPIDVTMRPFHPPRPSAAQSHHPRPGDPGRPPLLPLPMHQQINPAAFPPPGTGGGFGAVNPMAAVAAANPFLAMQLFGQAQQLQNLGYLASLMQQQQQHQHQQQQQPFFPGGFPPNPNQFGAFPGMQAGFNGGGGFLPGGSGLAGSRPPLPMMGSGGGNDCNGTNGGGVRPGGAGLAGSWPPLLMMGAAGNGCNVNGGGPGSPRPGLNVDVKDRNSDGRGSQVNNTNNKSDGISHVVAENGERNITTDQKSRFNPGTDGRDGRQFGPSGGRGRGDGRGGKQFSPSGGRGRGRGDARDGRGRGRNFNQGRGRGRNDWRDGKPNFTNSDSPTSGGRHIDSPTASEGGRKRPPIIYDQNEVQQWLQARKKNYPTSVNVNKKLTQSQLDDQKKDEDTQMRRQELKEVLAKQKELGLELPELPPGYLSDTEGQPREPQGNEKESKWRNQQRDSRFGNRGRGRGNKRQRNDCGGFQSKRPREWNNSHAMVRSREPTLFQKLVSSDIKRDRHRLLHTFKFMAQNNFFQDWPDKPLEFPSVKVNQVELELDDIAAEDLDDDELPDAEAAKDVSVELKENGDEQDSGSSSDEEAGSKDENEADEEEGEVSEEDADAEECDASEEEFSA
ncbi:hypothetical protein ACQ4PT_021980 [Festuca glaucescens]